MHEWKGEYKLAEEVYKKIQNLSKIVFQKHNILEKRQEMLRLVTCGNKFAGQIKSIKDNKVKIDTDRISGKKMPKNYIQN